MHVTRDELTAILPRLLAGETVELGVLKLWEDYLYQRKKDAAGNPVMKRVIQFVYFDEDEGDDPGNEDFDGTVESLAACLEAHGHTVREDADDDGD